jgi:two-component system response regulator RegX3
MSRSRPQATPSSGDAHATDGHDQGPPRFAQNAEGVPFEHKESVRVLLVEDEESFVEALVVGLGREGFSVTVARDGIEALRLFDASEPDIVLLDLMLPRLSGIDVCRAMRERSDVPIIIVTAKSTEIDTVVGLELGADDYVAKPYRLRELVARMRAVLRRARQRQRPATATERSLDPHGGAASDVLEASGVRMDLARRTVTVGGRAVELRRKEFALLELLMRNAGKVLTRDVLIDRVWGADYVGDTKTLDVHIKRLRARIEDDPSNPRLITTVRGIGYRFESEAR